ncbi:hypothetical protein [Pseudomonas poae]|uniref:Uncharacterized protein n=1 Tax=Pseudomonas poae TaxID=200451 RepID=A0A2S9E8G2_9PSED|nr:hypothetical protein [Pseudomonas poae]PRA32329.1 hypothetical protein CQZ97_06510 [Pseudomonas poae]PRC11141.1 hypothetical protein CQZ99_26695 [Pseudomonas poae]
MWLLDGFAWLYNLNRFTGALLMWFVVLVLTATVTMNVQNNRGKLWGFLITSAGAVFILLYLESLKLAEADEATKDVVSNFVVMTLGGLGSGLLAVAISRGPTEEEDQQARSFIRDRLVDALEYAFVFFGICSFTLFAVCLPLHLLAWPHVTEHDVFSLLIVCLGALLGYAIVSRPSRLEHWEQLGACALVALLLLLLPVYVQALSGLWQWRWWAVLGLHTFAALALFRTLWFHRIEWRRT